jgi:hypothetical protein
MRKTDRIDLLLDYLCIRQTYWLDHYVFFLLIGILWYLDIWHWWKILLFLYVLGGVNASYDRVKIKKVIKKELGL